VGRHFDEGDTLYSEPSENDLIALVEKFPDRVSEDMVEATREISEVLLKKGRLSVHRVLNYLRGVKK
ncbi:MAG: hypothetical protein RMH84_05370, partial [Sulfolobales archaeon]|nr:hypothetical protein [Sulfolobales archaeon]